jgi:hypothetical protein
MKRRMPLARGRSGLCSGVTERGLDRDGHQGRLNVLLAEVGDLAGGGLYKAATIRLRSLVEGLRYRVMIDCRLAFVGLRVDV